MKKRAFLVPLLALTAFSTAALAKIGNEAVGPKIDQSEGLTGGSIAGEAFKDLTDRSLAFLQQGDDVFAYTLDRQEDGTIVAQHRSHYSHSSHSSHRSHVSSRW